MKAHGRGRIVNIASVGGKIAVPHLLPYSVGKFMLRIFGWVANRSGDGITVTTVCPGLDADRQSPQRGVQGRLEEEYAWFSLGSGMPGLSEVNAETAAARKILSACARGRGKRCWVGPLSSQWRQERRARTLWRMRSHS